MAVIQFTDGDKLAGKVMEKGVYKARMTSIDQQASKSQKSVNFFTIITVTQEGKYMGKELNPTFNTETSSMSVLGNMQFIPHRDLLKIKAAIQKIKFDDVDLTLDTDELLNKDFDAYVDTAVAENGEMVNIVTGFSPVGLGAGKGPF